jgi:hypothetical protein
MAFSPFHWFRKHQKVFFAGLTVLCMFVFIGQAGVGADVFQNLLRWIGAGRGSRETLIVLDGKKVTANDIQEIARKRKMASDFLVEMAMRTHMLAVQTLLKEKVATDEAINPLSGLRKVLENTSQRSFGMFQIPPDELRRQILDDLRTIDDMAQRDKVKGDPDRLAILQNVATVLGFQLWSSAPTRLQAISMYLLISQVARGQQNPRNYLPEEFYFGGSNRQDRRADDALEFMVWQHQADKLGISLTDADLLLELKREAAGQDYFGEKVKDLERERVIVDYVKNREYGAQTTPRDLINALREEFRVVMAQGLMLGAEPGVRSYVGMFGATSSPAVGTPDEFLHYYRDQRTTLRVKMTPVSVSAFLDEVKGKPSEKELLNRYKQGFEKEPDPKSREPGFKEPRRIAVEYVSASPEDPHYREVAKLYTSLPVRAASTVGLALANPLLAVPAAVLDPYQVEYENYLKDRPIWVSPDGMDPGMQPGKLHLSSVLQPANIAATVGSLSASIQGGQNAFAAPTTLYATSTFVEARESLKANLAMLLARANSPGTGFSDEGGYPQSHLTWRMLTMAALPRPLPLETLKPQLQASLEKSIAQRVLQENLDKMRTELTKLRNKDTATIRAYIDKAVKDYHLTRQAMAKPLPYNVMVEEMDRKVDLNIRPLEEAYLARTSLHKVEDFVRSLFRSQGVYEAEPLTRRESDQREFLFWRTEDKSARTRPYDVVRGEVEAAWRFEEARKLARRKAESLEAEINSKNWRPEDAERYLREQKKVGETFELNNVAQLVPPTREVFPLRATEYVPYQVPGNLINQLTYSPPDMVKHLLTLKRLGSATVIVDEPAKNFFVAVLFDRDVPKVKQFEEMYKKPPSDVVLYTFFVESQRTEYYKAVMHQLRSEAAAGKLDKDGRFALPESYRKRGEGGQGADE